MIYAIVEGCSLVGVKCPSFFLMILENLGHSRDLLLEHITILSFSSSFLFSPYLFEFIYHSVKIKTKRCQTSHYNVIYLYVQNIMAVYK